MLWEGPAPVATQQHRSHDNHTVQLHHCNTTARQTRHKHSSVADGMAEPHMRAERASRLCRASSTVAHIRLLS